MSTEDTTIINEPINTKIAKFQKLLDNISTLEDKRKTLWLDVYTNAIQDREYAFQMYRHLTGFVASDPNQHALHGPNMAKYMERMSRANDQLLKLAELVGSAIDKDIESKTVTKDDLYDMFDATPEPKANSKKR